MISPLLVTLTKLILVLVLFSALLIILQRNISSLFNLYGAQSLLMAILAFMLFAHNGQVVLLALAILTIITKVVIIPYTLHKVQAGAAIKRDVEFRYLTPVSSVIIGIVLIFFVYYVLGKVLPTGDTLLTMGAVIGVSLSLMGMMIIFSRKKVITKVIGYLVMENGILLFIIELLIIVDLIIFIMLAVVLALGIDSTVEDFNSRLTAFTTWLKR
jgi:hydrogenase-4 component E